MKTTGVWMMVLVGLAALAPAPDANAVYHAGLGRWLTRDPVGYQDGPNPYWAVRGNPLAHSDPTGTICTTGCSQQSAPPAPARPLREEPARRCDGGATTPTDRTCCVKYFQDHPGASAATICCDGMLIWCVNLLLTRELAGPEGMAALRECTRECEPEHCANFHCRRPETINPRQPTIEEPIPNANGPLSFHCSECNVNACALSCLSGKCGDENCTALCGANPECQRRMKAILKAYEDNMAYHCRKCAEETAEVFGNMGVGVRARQLFDEPVY